MALVRTPVARRIVRCDCRCPSFPLAIFSQPRNLRRVDQRPLRHRLEVVSLSGTVDGVAAERSEVVVIEFIACRIGNGRSRCRILQETTKQIGLGPSKALKDCLTAWEESMVSKQCSQWLLYIRRPAVNGCNEPDTGWCRPPGNTAPA